MALFQPGQSGNPNGKPSKKRLLIDELITEDHVKTAFDVILADINNPKSKTARDSARWLLEMKLGKAKQQVDLGNDDSGQFVVKLGNSN